MLLYRHDVTATDSRELTFTLLSTSWLAIPAISTYFATILKYGIKIRQTQTELHIKLLRNWTKQVWEKFVDNNFTISLMTMVRQWILHTAHVYKTQILFVLYFRIRAATQTTKLLLDWLTTNCKQFGIGHGWMKVQTGICLAWLRKMMINLNQNFSQETQWPARIQTRKLPYTILACSHHTNSCSIQLEDHKFTTDGSMHLTSLKRLRKLIW